MTMSLLKVAMRPAHGRGRRSLRALPAATLAALATGLAVVVVIAAVFWGIAQHRVVHSTIIEVETGRFIAEFREAPVAPAWRRLSAVWQRELDRQNALLDRIAAADDSGAGIRHFRHFVLETVQENRLQREIAVVVGYFRRLALCVRIGSCDADAVRARFGDLPKRFLNQHFLYLRESHPEQDLVPVFDPLTSPGRQQTAPASS